jgi:hypothetical protein
MEKFSDYYDTINEKAGKRYLAFCRHFNRVEAWLYQAYPENLC